MRLFDERTRKNVETTKLGYQTTTATFGDTNEFIFYGGVDNQIKAWNIKSEDKEEFSLLGHTDTVTGKNPLKFPLFSLYRYKSKQ